MAGSETVQFLRLLARHCASAVPRNHPLVARWSGLLAVAVADPGPEAREENGKKLLGDFSTNLNARQRRPEASSGYVRGLARSATRKAAPAVRPLSRHGVPAAEMGDTSVVSTASCTPPQRQPVRDNFYAFLVLEH